MQSTFSLSPWACSKSQTTAHSTLQTQTHAFLFGLLRCGSVKKDDFDYKALLETVVRDLLKILFRPEFPAAELLLSQLAAMLVRFSRLSGVHVYSRLFHVYASLMQSRAPKGLLLYDFFNCGHIQLKIIKDIKCEATMRVLAIDLLGLIASSVREVRTLSSLAALSCIACLRYWLSS